MATLLKDHIDHSDHSDGDAPALVDDSGTLSWRELDDRVNRWISVLTGLGLGSGDRLACVLGNRRETFEVLLACLHTGITVVPVNWHLTEPEIVYIVADSGSRLLVTEPAFAPAAAPAGRSVAGCANLLVLGDDDLAGCRAVEPLLAAASAEEPADQRCGATMLYTSGTTGAPKGVINGLFVVDAPFSRVSRLADYARVVLGVPARGRVLLDGPWYHSSQLFYALLSLLQGSRLVIRPSFDPAATLRTIDAQQITAVHLVPTQFIRLLRLDPSVRQAFSGASLRTVWHGGGPCPPEVKRQMIDWWGPVLVEYYGATEGGVVTQIDSADWLRRPGSVGRAVPPGELLIVGEDGNPVPAGTPGRIFVRRRSGERFRYHNEPDKTRSAYLGSDTFTYGEVGYLDADGFLYLTGRA
ncbi:MAG: AMP-binding protein, partial [Actinobacteria bacterium]|nr:AMP-binding protein [Actinomycetota bacterium]